MYPKKFSDYFYQTEFFQHHNQASKLLYILYTLSGGMYYENYMRSWFKYLLIFVDFFSVAFLFANYLIALIQTRTSELSLILMIVSTLAFQISLFSIIVVNYNSRKKLHYVMNTLSILEQVKPTRPQMNGDERYKVYDFNKYLTVFYKCLVIFSVFLMWLGKIFFVFIAKGIHLRVHPFYDYIYPFPLAKSSRISGYIVAYHFQIITLLLPVLNFVSSTTLLFSFPAYFNNQLVLLRREMKLESQFGFKILHRVYNTEAFVLDNAFRWTNPKSLGMEKRREIFSKKFAGSSIKWIQRYQQLISTINILRDYFEAILNMNVLSIMIPIIFLAYIASKAWRDVSAIYIIYLAEMIVLLLVNCLFGNIFQQMNDGLAEEIYRTPWYYLPPEQRKLLLTFLTLTRNFRKIRIFKAYPLTLELYPKILGKLFSYVQIMRGMENRTQL